MTIRFKGLSVLVMALLLLVIGVACSRSEVPPSSPPDLPSNGQPIGSLAPVERTPQPAGQNGLSPLNGLEGENVSQINIELSQTSEALEQYFFIIQRDTSQVRFLNPETEEISVGTGEILARLILETSRTASFLDLEDGEVHHILGMVIQYDRGILRLLESNDQFADLILHATIDLARLQDRGGVASASAQATDEGLTATLEVDVTSQDENSASQGGSAGLDLSQDKAQRALELSERINKGTIAINVLYRGVAESVAFAPAPIQNRPSDTPEIDPENNPNFDTPPDQLVGGGSPQSGNDGSDGSGSSGTSSSPEPSPPPEDPPEADPEGREDVADDGGSPVISNGRVSVMIVLDKSQDFRLYDSRGSALDAAVAFVEAALPNDQIGVVTFGGSRVETYELTEIRRGAKRKVVPESLEETILSSFTGVDTVISLFNTALGEACNRVHFGINPDKAVLLFSDGVATYDPNFGRLPEEDCEGLTIPVYAFGLGNKDDDELFRIAKNTVGQYIPIEEENTENIICEVQQIRAKMLGYDQGICDTFKLGYKPPPVEGEYVDDYEVKEFTVPVPLATKQVSFSAMWNEGDFDMRVTKPGGGIPNFEKLHPEAYPPIIGTDRKSELFIIDRPQEGQWKIEFMRKDNASTEVDMVFGFNAIPVNPN